MQTDFLQQRVDFTFYCVKSGFHFSSNATGSFVSLESISFQSRALYET